MGRWRAYGFMSERAAFKIVGEYEKFMQAGIDMHDSTPTRIAFSLPASSLLRDSRVHARKPLVNSPITK